MGDIGVVWVVIGMKNENIEWGSNSGWSSLHSLYTDTFAKGMKASFLLPAKIKQVNDYMHH